MANIQLSFVQMVLALLPALVPFFFIQLYGLRLMKKATAAFIGMLLKYAVVCLLLVGTTMAGAVWADVLASLLFIIMSAIVVTRRAKLAMGDVSGSFPSSQAILEMLSQIRQAAVTVNKQGLLHVHLGSIPNPFDIFEEIAASGFPIGTHLRPTHCARTEFLLKSACTYAMGASDRYIDITTDGPCYLGHPAAAVSAAVSCGVPVEQITLSSDGTAWCRVLTLTAISPGRP